MKTGIYKNVDKVFSGPEGALNTLLYVLKGLLMISEELANQIEKTLEAISKKHALEPEKVLVSYISRYERVLEIIQGTTRENTDVKVVKPLLNLARGYMETSSNYSQPFLEEMGKTESLIKQCV